MAIHNWLEPIHFFSPLVLLVLFAICPPLAIALIVWMVVRAVRAPLADDARTRAWKKKHGYL